jgi:D-threo-aldose 1-dehydrogenase
MAVDPFELRALGDSGVRVTRLGLGTAPLGGWPRAVAPDDGVATVRRAWEAGLRYVDTAPFYGYGNSERYIGAALGGAPRDAFALSTKVGRVLEPGRGDEPALYEGVPDVHPVFDFSPEGVLRSLRSSRERLGTERIDVVYIHDPDDHHEEALSGAYPALARMRAEGEIGAIGVGMNAAEPLARFAAEADFDCMLVAGRYTLLEQRSLDDLLPVALERNVAIVAGGVFNSGLLVDPRDGATYDYAPAPAEVLERARRLAAVCTEFGVALRAAALQFPSAHPAVASVVVGARSPREVDDNLALLAVDLPDELWVALKERGLLREDAPTPAGDRAPHM